MKSIYYSICCLMCVGVVGCTPEPPLVEKQIASIPDNIVIETNDSVVDQQVAKPSKEFPPPKILTQAEVNAGWISLFDGQTLFGWQGDENVWSVKEGVIQGNGEQGNLLMTTSPFVDYELRCEFRLEKAGNSGIFLRTAAAPKNPAVDCYEFNLCDTHKEYKTGSLVARTQPKTEIAAVDDIWHTVSITCDGSKIQASIDGKVILDFNDESDKFLTSGFIGLQMNGGRVQFRNIALRPLKLNSLFDGKTLTGWRIVPGSKSQFAVKEGAIKVTNGSGFLETEKTWGNFLLQFDVKTNGEQLNSGLFFRAELGTEKAPSNGYELQVHYGFDDDDRTKPIDYKTGFGSGAIFRRQKARWVMGNDFEWCKLTLIANDNHFASWVNGYQVTDFHDTRELDSNPRKGTRLEAGHFSLQGHDPTTDVSFRNLNAIEYPQ